ncbi:MAG: glutathione transferase GstA [Sideroxyarcus sp.]|nr:glutathione transferase GstA [Sideroxyarcus sp.]
MKLYYIPGACSLSSHIVLSECGLPYDLEKVDCTTMKTERGIDYRTINPKGYVPAIELDNGEVLTEAAVIAQYVADLVPEKGLSPPYGSVERYRLMEWLNFIATEIHKGFSPLFHPKITDEMKTLVIERLNTRIDYVAKQLEGKNYLLGNHFSVADAYLFTILSWAKNLKVDLSRWSVLSGYMRRIGDRPAVFKALAEEGLIEGSKKVERGTVAA